jgi:transcriptional regulator with XRE-family HTH domain
MSDTNRGAILTRQHLEETGQKQADLARVCGVSDVTALNWLRCSMKPVAARRKIIARWSGGGVPVEAWDEAANAAPRAA